MDGLTANGEKLKKGNGPRCFYLQRMHWSVMFGDLKRLDLCLIIWSPLWSRTTSKPVKTVISSSSIISESWSDHGDLWVVCCCCDLTSKLAAMQNLPEPRYSKCWGYEGHQLWGTCPRKSQECCTTGGQDLRSKAQKRWQELLWTLNSTNPAL
jgi:hypothetical protein